MATPAALTQGGFEDQGNTNISPFSSQRKRACVEMFQEMLAETLAAPPSEESNALYGLQRVSDLAQEHSGIIASLSQTRKRCGFCVTGIFEHTERSGVCSRQHYAFLAQGEFRRALPRIKKRRAPPDRAAGLIGEGVEPVPIQRGRTQTGGIFRSASAGAGGTGATSHSLIIVVVVVAVIVTGVFVCPVNFYGIDIDHL